MSKRKSEKSMSSRPRATAGEQSVRVPTRLAAPLVARVRDYCRSHAHAMVVVGTHLDQLYATDVLDLRRRVSLGIAAPQELAFVTVINGAEAATRKIQVHPEPNSWVTSQEWAVDTESVRHLRMRLHAALHDYQERIVPMLEEPRFIADNALSAVYLTWLLVDAHVAQLFPHTASCQALPWGGEHGRDSLATEWFTPARIEQWVPLLERSLALLGAPSGEAKQNSLALAFEQSAEGGDVVRAAGQADPQTDADAVTFVAKSVVRLAAQDLQRFDPAAISLREIGGHYFQLISAQALALASARCGQLGFLDVDAWTRIHTQFRLALEFAIRCASGLGFRLRATGLFTDPFQIEKRAGEIALELKQLEFLAGGATPGEQRLGMLFVPRIQALAGELGQIGRTFAHVPPEALAEAQNSDTSHSADAVSATDDIVTLDQAAALVKQSKRTLERWLKDGKLPAPDIVGGGGKAHRWIWARIREPLQNQSGLIMPAKSPGNRVM